MEPIEVEEDPTWYLSPTWYNRLRFLVQIVSPALITLVLSLDTSVGIPSEEAVIGVISSITVFLGVLLRFSRKRYEKSPARFDGVIEVSTNDQGVKVISQGYSIDPLEIENKKELTFKVDSQLPPPVVGS